MNMQRSLHHLQPPRHIHVHGELHLTQLHLLKLQCDEHPVVEEQHVDWARLVKADAAGSADDEDLEIFYWDLDRARPHQEIEGRVIHHEIHTLEKEKLLLVLRQRKGTQIQESKGAGVEDAPSANTEPSNNQIKESYTANNATAITLETQCNTLTNLEVRLAEAQNATNGEAMVPVLEEDLAMYMSVMETLAKDSREKGT
ncbi:hypothetical protein SESBI_34709 [Sesbania bispinosa]|nr:hypothetical protein SESBI_34709 [Sesbania bispinosa]